VLLWIALTAAGEALMLLDLFPVEASEFAKESDEIFLLLMYIGIPVWAFAVAVVIYGILQFRQQKAGETGATFRGTGLAPRLWVLITAGLATAVMIHPGLTGLAKLQDDSTGYGWGDREADMVLNVTARQFMWEVEYPAEGIKLQAIRGNAPQPLTLPVHTKIRFNINSTDVVHSFWVPAWRMKIDAMPGRTTFVTIETTSTGEFHQTNKDSAFRIQCAELCGEGHQTMDFPIRVVERGEYEAWLREMQASQPQTQAGAR
jgi:cytochrome c oxidase subunit 2